MSKRYFIFLPIPAVILIIAALHLTVKPSVFLNSSSLIPIANILLLVTGMGLCCQSPRNPLNFQKEKR